LKMIIDNNCARTLIISHDHVLRLSVVGRTRFTSRFGHIET
jgi:hypothetical protein